MIDTNELRELADSLQYSHACKCGDNGKCHTVNIMEDSAAELDRLYDVERRTTPLTREEIEAELVDAGYESKGKTANGHEMFVRKSDSYQIKVNSFAEGEEQTLNIMGTFSIYNVPIYAVTRRLLRDCGITE